MFPFALFPASRSQLFCYMPELREQMLLVCGDLSAVDVCLLVVPDLEDVRSACLLGNPIGSSRGIHADLYGFGSRKLPYEPFVSCNYVPSE